MKKNIFPKKVEQIFDLLEKAGATDIFVVGGFVRDQVLNIPNKDMDVEVYGLSFSEIAQALSARFRFDLVGQSFGVLKIDNEIDISLPRKESKTGIGHKAFDICSDPHLSLREAFARRDFTINAIGMRRDGSFYDPFDGIGDLRRGILRATSSAFKDDPLRVLRGMQFSARFGFDMDSQTIQYCRELFPEYSSLSEERIYEEWVKWATKGKWIQKSLQLLHETGWIAAFPELNALIGCPQNPCWHPEGDVFVHTSLVCQELAQIVQTQFPDLSEEDRIVLMFAALGHDFGKAVTTRRDENGVIRSLGHAEASVPLIQTFLNRIKTPHRIIAKVLPLVREHMSLMNLERSKRPSPKMVRRLAWRLKPANIKLWTILCQSDARGCFAPERHYQQEPEQSVQKAPLFPHSISHQESSNDCQPSQPYSSHLVSYQESSNDCQPSQPYSSHSISHQESSNDCQPSQPNSSHSVSHQESSNDCQPSQPNSSHSVSHRENEINHKIRFRADLWFELAQELEIAESQPQPLIRGRDLIQRGIKPGPEMGQILQAVFEAQLDGIFTDFNSGIQYLKDQWPEHFSETN